MKITNRTKKQILTKTNLKLKEWIIIDGEGSFKLDGKTKDGKEVIVKFEKGYRTTNITIINKSTGYTILSFHCKIATREQKTTTHSISSYLEILEIYGIDIDKEVSTEEFIDFDEIQEINLIDWLEDTNLILQARIYDQTFYGVKVRIWLDKDTYDKVSNNINIWNIKDEKIHLSISLYTLFNSRYANNEESHKRLITNEQLITFLKKGGIDC